MWYECRIVVTVSAFAGMQRSTARFAVEEEGARQRSAGAAAQPQVENAAAPSLSGEGSATRCRSGADLSLDRRHTFFMRLSAR